MCGGPGVLRPGGQISDSLPEGVTRQAQVAAAGVTPQALVMWVGVPDPAR
ncbi:hypothetical protein TRM7557_01380 [Tritonibacter multivorans]|uniref:Uncharacterized protein n=1 Tax=Tritonibacter multivorans TaxID=928856 RepID=A0A0P1G790_9RHOB|nr:hypothetical protein TRM7557_01380 [Tritonibacter multivorans]SFD32313.1 hypothetical protein SAMN04488049_11136 [Tritonibacter multivorans]